MAGHKSNHVLALLNENRLYIVGVHDADLRHLVFLVGRMKRVILTARMAALPQSAGTSSCLQGQDDFFSKVQLFHIPESCMVQYSDE